MLWNSMLILVIKIILVIMILLVVCGGYTYGGFTYR